MADASKRPEDSDFKQQRLKAWQPILTPQWVIGSFAFIGILFPIIGAILLVTSKQVVQVEHQYSDVCSLNTTCQVNITIPANMNSPVYFYYKLTNFYQNHRRYVKSKSTSQLMGNSDSSLSSNCDPLVTNPNSHKTLYPCGLIAGSYFTDKFAAEINGTAVSWTGTGIAWTSDVTTKFKSRAITADETNIVLQNGVNVTLPAVNVEEFIVWMRVAGLPTFKKLNRIINQDLKAGEVLTVTISNNYDVSTFSGTKSIVISTTTWLGGKNDFLGYAYIVVGLICLALAGLFLIKHMRSPRAIGDMEYFKYGEERVEAVELKH
eukprot:TRINITY_DN1472_c0_g1_i1.p1 TRINITY_DN1472_c0_g1~~TRINITY_DN1472_c0_g1_i1.p1  ORF type:complete len:320 (-),score=81.09 TRINITY_DN1472_c0_g1_i1:36-995(-)